MLRTLLAISLLAVACAGPGATTQPTSAPTIAPTAAMTDAPATTEPTAEPTQAATADATAEPTQAGTEEPTMGADATVTLADEGYLVGPEGLSLYTFDNDEPGTSNCEGECLVNWPALSVEDASALTVGEGLDAAQFGTITRSDGTMQVTMDEMPLYYFVGDSAAGDTNGDGLNDVWHLARPDGATGDGDSTVDPIDY